MSMPQYRRDGADAAHRGAKKRMPSYKARKEETRELHAQVNTLETQLLVLQERLGMLDSTGSELAASMKKAELLNTQLRRAIARQQLALAETQSMMLQCIDREQRRETILGFKDDQFSRVHEYLSSRSRHLDLSKPHFSEERFEDPDGASCCLRYEVVQFEGVQSLRQVFDALVFFLLNMEISISETLGDITVREDYDSMDGDALLSNHRLISKDVTGATVEMNMVALGQYFPGGDSISSVPYAMGSTVPIDQDDVYPYQPNERIRKDVSAGLLLTELRCEGENAAAIGQEPQIVVVLQRAAYVRHPRPPFALSAHTKKQLQDGIARWGDVMLKSMRSMLYSL